MVALVVGVRDPELPTCVALCALGVRFFLGACFEAVWASLGPETLFAEVVVGAGSLEAKLGRGTTAREEVETAGVSNGAGSGCFVRRYLIK